VCFLNSHAEYAVFTTIFKQRFIGKLLPKPSLYDKINNKKGHNQCALLYQHQYKHTDSLQIVPYPHYAEASFLLCLIDDITDQPINAMPIKPVTNTGTWNFILSNIITAKAPIA
jgi:hypothetical protein